MKDETYSRIKNRILPFIGLAMLTGFLTAIWITLFKMAVEFTINISTSLYDFLRENPIWLPVFLFGAATIGLAVSFILSHSHSCKGGGIPTSIVAIRGIVNFKRFASICVMPFSALLTFLCGIPLGTEGPCVQMGTAPGDVIVVYYKTYDEETTYNELTVLMGEQEHKIQQILQQPQKY